jgi:hypothetical protein
MPRPQTVGNLASTARLCLILIVFAFVRASWAAPDQPAREEVRIRLQPSPAGGPVPRIAIPASDRLNQNAAPLYVQAAELIESESESDKWLDQLRDDGVSEQGEAALAENRPALAKLRQAACGNKCEWDNPPALESLGRYRSLARLAVLQVRVDVAAKRYAQAIQTLSAGYRLAEALTSEDTKLVHGLTAVSIAALMDEQAFWMLQQPGVPTLDFSELPPLLLGLQNQSARELTAAKASAPNPLAAAALARILEPSHAPAVLLATRGEREFDALRALQALRAFAGRNNGQLPQILPSSPAATRPASTRPAARPPLAYQRTSPTAAVLTVKLAKEDERGPSTYRITLAAP